MIGRRITPSDFENLPNLKGINIQKGVAAFIYIDGKEASEIHGGTYEFITQSEIDKYLEQKVNGGLVSYINRGLKAVGSLITGRKIKKQLAENTASDLAAIKTIDDVIARLRPDSSIEVYLLWEQPFSVLFQSFLREDGTREFRPFSIRCKNLSVDISLTLQLRISDPRSVLLHFLSNRNYLSTYMLEEELTSRIRSILEEELRDTDIDETGIPANKRMLIEARLKNLSGCLPGVELVSVADISASNKDLNRLRQISDELFVSEKELEAAIRTNDFRNKLATVENQVKIDEAGRGFALYQALAEIDKEKALHAEEMEQFHMLLSCRNQIRKAQNEEEVRKALQELERNKLLSQDAMDELLLQLADKKLSREAISEMVNMQHLADVEQKRLDIEAALTKSRHDQEIEELIHQNKITAISLDGKRLVDEYEDERITKTRDSRREDELWEEERERKKQESFKSFMDSLIEQNEKIERAKHERTMETKKIDYAYEKDILAIQSTREENKLRVQSMMTYEQILAARGDLDPVAQAALAATAGSQKAYEVERQHSEEMRRMWLNEREDHKEQLKLHDAHFSKVLDSERALQEEKMRLNEERFQNQTELTQEYRAEKQQAQERQDNYSRHVMEHEERLQSASLGMINAISGRGLEKASEPELVKCPSCGQQVPSGRFCLECGSEMVNNK